MAFKWCLIVDDESEICEIVSDFMTDLGYKTVSANAGSEAIFKMEKQKFDLMITDLKMPNMSGIDLIETIRNRKNKKSTGDQYNFPIIVMSGNLREFKSEMALIEDLHLIEKPFEKEELVEIVQNITNSDSPIKKRKGNDLENLYKSLVSNLTESLAIVCKEKPQVVDQDVFFAPCAVEGPVLVSYFLKLNAQDYQLHLGVTQEWASQAAKALSPNEGNNEISKDRIVYVVRQLSNAIINKLIKSLNRAQLSTQVIDHTLFYNLQDRVSTRIEGGKKLRKTKLSTLLGDFVFYLSYPQSLED